MAAIESAGIAVLTVDAYKVFSIRTILQGTGGTTFMIVERGGLYAIASTLRFIASGILCISDSRQQRDSGIKKYSFHIG